MQCKSYAFVTTKLSLFILHSSLLIHKGAAFAILPPVAFVANVQPCAAILLFVFEQQLVERAVIANEIEHFPTHFFVRNMNVGSLAQQMLRRSNTPYRLIEQPTAKAARDAYHAESPSQRFQHMHTQLLQACNLLFVGHVIDMLFDGSSRENKLLKIEMRRELPFLHVVFHNFVFYQ